ncbi:quinone oxidoreductase-like protein 1 isoform X2 [Xenia sp. Carnegie-2017]|uniref:quinone oxidoreductase-like protein 1 isoform X2 n=1 Tax=Xenia sp. Carnegie-2017 TaxID=2897299 RepID=UPI001F03382D|nr:quinone oxidoreductase-like protein 1 isoform X2 [Xenia sp. Carnegie-2017]
MTNQRIIWRTSNNAYEIEENVEVEAPTAHEVIIKVKACVLDEEPDIELLQEFKIIDNDVVLIGRKISGVVTEVGEGVSRFSIGDEVVGMIPPNTSNCGCAHFCAISEFNIVKKPEKINFADAACCIGDGLSAYTALHYQAKLAGGETVLVMNGASGPGIMAIQLAQSWGAKVITTACSEEEKLLLQGIKPEIGRIVDLTSGKTSLLNICLEETGSTGVDCIIDCGVEQFPNDIAKESKHGCSVLPSKHDLILSLAVGGRWITKQHDLQLDPPHSKMLYLKGATIAFHFTHSWTLAKGQQGRFLRILVTNTFLLIYWTKWRQEY